MKISEMTNDQATETLIRLSVPFGNICEDEETVKVIDSFKNAGDTLFIHTIGKLLPQITAYLFRTHKEDVYEIVGALTFSTVEQVAKMNFVETIRVLRESYDEVLQGFFTSSVSRIKKAAEKS